MHGCMHALQTLSSHRIRSAQQPNISNPDNSPMYSGNLLCDEDDDEDDAAPAGCANAHIYIMPSCDFPSASFSTNPPHQNRHHVTLSVDIILPHTLPRALSPSTHTQDAHCTHYSTLRGVYCRVSEALYLEFRRHTPPIAAPMLRGRAA